MSEQQYTDTIQDEENSFNLQDFLGVCLSHWKWFALSLVVFLGLAIAYLLKTPPTYTRWAAILIKEDTKGRSISTSTADALGKIGLYQSNTNVINEMAQIQSPDVMQTVVRRLGLNINYFREGRFHKEIAYGTTLPVKVQFSDNGKQRGGTFAIQIHANGTFTLSDFEYKLDEDEEGETPVAPDKSINAKPDQKVQTPLGELTVYTTKYFEKGVEDKILVARSSIHAAISVNMSKLTIELMEKEGTVINMTFSDGSIERADDVLNTLIQVYNENWVKDKNQIAVSTSEFINERLVVIENELGSVDKKISSYKSANLIPDVQAASSLYMSESSQNNTQMLALNNQLSMAKFVRDYLTSTANKNQLLPANSGIDNNSIEQQIAQYNNKLLERNNIVASSSERNPLVVDYDASLREMASSILTSIDNYIATLNISLSNIRESDARNTARIASSPTQAQHLLSGERQQKVKEALYLFLLQKREENELSQAFTAYNTRVVTNPCGSNNPSGPARKKIMLVAFALGLFIPLAILYIREISNTKVRGRKDVEDLSLPFLGEIPMWTGAKKTKWYQIFKRKKKEEQTVEESLVVRHASRNVINEAFRVLRTNLEFVAGTDATKNVIIVTSFNPGSGKSFLTLNIGASLSIKNKRVLIIDGDLRHGSTSKYVNSPKKGISDYLGGKTNDLQALIVASSQFPNMSILPVGTFPPNPTELIGEERFAQVIATLRTQYDYVFIDCPPIEVVADTQIIETCADRTLFVVRAGLLERSMLKELENIYKEKKLKNMSLILNGTEATGGYNRYGYHYGYRYGYHYGYGYYQDSSKEDSEEA